MLIPVASATSPGGLQIITGKHMYLNAHFLYIPYRFGSGFLNLIRQVNHSQQGRTTRKIDPGLR